MATITSVSAVFLLNIPGVTAGPVQLIGFGVDDAFTADLSDGAETQIGVDGYGVAGRVPRAVSMTIRFLASSPSSQVFDDWIAIQDQIGDILYATGSISYPAISRKYTMYQGTLMRLSNIADARKVLQNREFHITWLPNGPVQAISGAPL